MYVLFTKIYNCLSKITKLWLKILLNLPTHAHTIKTNKKKTQNNSKAFNMSQIRNSLRYHLVAKATVAADDNS